MAHGFAFIRKEKFPDELLDRQRWLGLINEIPELRLVETVEGINPLTRSKMIMRVDGAELICQGTRVGLFVWRNGEIAVDGLYSMFPMAQRIAQELGARVVDDAGDELLNVPDDD